MPGFTPFHCPQPQWQGEEISDKSLLVYTEQGNGDAIQFVRLPGKLPSDSFDLYIPMMSLAKILAVSVDTIPGQAPYLTVPSHIQVPR